MIISLGQELAMNVYAVIALQSALLTFLQFGEKAQDSSKGGAVEAGCSDLYVVIYSFIT